MTVAYQPYSTARGGSPKTFGSATGQEDEDLQLAVRAAYWDAQDYIDGHIAPLRALATRMYRGEPFGNEEEGRSQVVMTEVRDTVQAIMPSLLRIFVSSDSVVEFIPNNAASVALAEQQTDYVNHVFYHDNPGFMNIYSAFKDALVRKTGVLKWWWTDEVKVTETRFTGIDGGQVVVLQQEPGVSVLSLEESETSTPEAPSYDVHIRRKVAKNRVCIQALPPEEYLIERNARDEATAVYQCHRTFKPVSELVALGYDPEEIEEHKAGGETFSLNFEAQTRNPAVFGFMNVSDNFDPSMEMVLYCEHYIRTDADGDGIAELHRICTIGEHMYVLHDEVVEDPPFAVLCPDPEPHMVIGQSVADQTMDLQLIKSNMMRAMLDSLASSIMPRTVVVEGMANIDDAMNTEQGAIIRTKNLNAVQELVKPFVGQQALPVVAYMDTVKQKRTGMTEASQGLDPTMLQSATHSAVQATVTGAQERVELYARIFAEGPIKRLFTGVAKLLREHQDRERIVKLRGKFVAVNPRSWEGDLECTPSIALGKGTDQDKMSALGLIIGKQEEIIKTLGIGNPFVTPKMYRNALGKFVNLAGFKDTDNYFGELTDEQVKAMTNQPPPPNPQMELVKVEAMKVQGELRLKALKQAQDAQDAWMKHLQAQEKARVDALIALTKIEAEHGRAVSEMQLNTMLSHVAASADRDAETARHAHEQQMALAAQMHGQTLDAAAAMHANTLAAGTERRGQDIAAAQPATAQ